MNSTRVRHGFRGLRRLRGIRSVLLLVLITTCVVVFARGGVSRDQLQQFVTALPTELFVPAWLILPLVGFPISILLLVSGLKLGLWLAMGVATASMGMHTVAAWHVTHSGLRTRLEQSLEETSFRLPRIPPKHQIWFTSLFVTVPGLPYAVKLYSLGLTDLPFRRYVLIVWLCHSVNSVPFIGLGAAAADINVAWLTIFALAALAMIWVTHRLRRMTPELDDSGPTPIEE